MDAAQLVLVGAGIVAIIMGVARARGPLATIRRLDATQANLDRYDTWRGTRTELEPDGPTGADVMRGQMRQRLVVWGGLAVVGITLVLVGLLLD